MSKAEQPAASRRDFIKLSSGVILAATVGGTDRLYAATTGAPPVVSVGYWAGVPKVARRFRSASQAYLAPASSLLTGDPGFFATGARIAVRGLWRPEHLRTSAASLTIDAMFDVDGTKVPFFAWSYAANASVTRESRSSNVTFDVPVDALGTLDLVVHRSGERQAIRFSVNSAADTLMLRPGFYFLALETGEQVVDWSRVKIRDGVIPYQLDPKGAGVLSTAMFADDEQPVSFSYLVLWIDVAPPAITS